MLKELNLYFSYILMILMDMVFYFEQTNGKLLMNLLISSFYEFHFLYIPIFLSSPASKNSLTNCCWYFVYVFRNLFSSTIIFPFIISISLNLFYFEKKEGSFLSPPSNLHIFTPSFFRKLRSEVFSCEPDVFVNLSFLVKRPAKQGKNIRVNKNSD